MNLYKETKPYTILLIQPYTGQVSLPCIATKISGLVPLGNILNSLQFDPTFAEPRKQEKGIFEDFYANQKETFLMHF